MNAVPGLAIGAVHHICIGNKQQKTGVVRGLAGCVFAPSARDFCHAWRQAGSLESRAFAGLTLAIAKFVTHPTGCPALTAIPACVLQTPALPPFTVDGCPGGLCR